MDGVRHGAFLNREGIRQQCGEARRKKQETLRGEYTRMGRRFRRFWESCKIASVIEESTKAVMCDIPRLAEGLRPNPGGSWR
jgi:hypothetical protein